MAYISIYRRYRPSNWNSIVEQTHIVKILKNQINNDMVSHAYLFTGTRGTGKTSIAKIFAKAVNCESPIDGDACCSCPSCESMQGATSLDVIEMDAASNNGVDEIRNIKEEIKYRPTVCKYKVYIIDEVHMLSAGAFNALLKTLEEPPSHVIFILATTEVHKLPQTILSRCMCFDFRLVSTQAMVGRLREILDDMGVTYEESALQAIAEAGEGSVRDCLSVADICVSYCEGHITYNDVLSVLGAANPNTIVDLIRAVFDRDESKILNMLAELSSLGKSPVILTKDIASMARDMFFLKVTNNNRASVFLPNELIDKLISIESFNEAQARVLIDEMSQLESRMRYSTMPQLLLEAALIRLTAPPVATITQVIQQPTVHTTTVQAPKADAYIPIAEEPPIEAMQYDELAETGAKFPVREAMGLVLKDYLDKRYMYKSKLIESLDIKGIHIRGDRLVIDVSDSSLHNDLVSNQCDKDIVAILSPIYGVQHCDLNKTVDKNNLQEEIEYLKNVTSRDVLTIKRN